MTAAPASAAEPNSNLFWTSDFSALESTSNNVSVDGQTLRMATTSNPGSVAQQNDSIGIAMFAPRQLARPATTVSAEVAGQSTDRSMIAVDVRGLRGDGTWGEWTEASPSSPARLTQPTTTVQTRLYLTAARNTLSPQVQRVRLTASFSPQANVGQAGPLALTYRVFATREGLVGGTTANGHVIGQRDHFVALPSRRGLSANGARNFSVRVCADNGRCETAPVWDVGPWNTTDDYWNPSSTRQNWRDLPQGRPEAQAAYQNGYNGHKDEFGRVVANPAGIDLADGTFWDGLGLQDNSFVNVTYLWT